MVWVQEQIKDQWKKLSSSERDLYLYKDLIQENDGTKNQWGKGWNVWKYWEN